MFTVYVTTVYRVVQMLHQRIIIVVIMLVMTLCY